MGGMVAASILSKFGKKVVVLENHDKLGGCTHTFSWSRENMDGDGHTTCEFDTGCHYTALDMAMDTQRSGALLKYVTEGGAKFHDLGDPWDILVLPHDPNVDPGCPNSDQYNFMCGREPLVRSIADAINPQEPEVVNRLHRLLDFCRYARQSISGMFVARLAPRWLESMLLGGLKEKYFECGALSTDYVLSAMLEHGMTKDQVVKRTKLPDSPSVDLPNTWNRLKGVMVHPLGDYACQPRDSTFVAHALTSCYYMNGAAYTDGPTQSIAHACAKVVHERGGESFVNCHVDGIMLEGGKAVGVRVCKATTWESQKNNEEKPTMVEIRAKAVVNAAGMHNLYHKLLPQDLPLVDEYKTKNKAVPSYGHVYLFVCIKGDADEVGIPKTNTWYFNGYDTDACFDKYFADPTEHRPPTVYLGFPCTKDPSWNSRFPGISNCILISDGLYEWFEQWEDMRTHKRGGEYEQLKQKFADKLLDVLYDKVPQVKGKVLWYECGTPVSDANFLGSYKGGSYGTRCNLDFASRESQRWVMRGDTEIPNLYMAGQDAWTPAVAGAMYGGLMGAAKVLGTFQSLGILSNIVKTQAAAIRAKTGFSAARAYAKAVRLFLGDEPWKIEQQGNSNQDSNNNKSATSNGHTHANGFSAVSNGVSNGHTKND